MGEIEKKNKLELNGLLKEYDRFYEIIKDRSSDTWLLGSILIATSLVIYLSTVLYAQYLWAILPLAIISGLCFGVWILFYIRASALDNICFEQLRAKERRIQQITEKMCIDVHRFLEREDRLKCWREKGKWIFYGFFIIFVILWLAFIFLWITYN